MLLTGGTSSAPSIAFEDLKLMGAPPEMLAEHKTPEVEVFEITPGDETTVEVFLRVITQFNAVDGGFVGLNYQSVDFVFRLYKVKRPKFVFEGLRIMERAALPIFNKKA